MNLEKCPWCGAEAEWSDPSRGRSGYAVWICGSRKSGDEPHQSERCEWSECEAIYLRDIGKLRREREAYREVAVRVWMRGFDDDREYATGEVDIEAAEILESGIQPRRGRND